MSVRTYLCACVDLFLAICCFSKLILILICLHRLTPVLWYTVLIEVWCAALHNAVPWQRNWRQIQALNGVDVGRGQKEAEEERSG